VTVNAGSRCFSARAASQSSSASEQLVVRERSDFNRRTEACGLGLQKRVVRGCCREREARASRHERRALHYQPALALFTRIGRRARFRTISRHAELWIALTGQFGLSRRLRHVHEQATCGGRYRSARIMGGKSAALDSRDGGFTGRDTELAVLEGALAPLARGRASVAVVRSPSGMGKTALVGRSRTLLVARGSHLPRSHPC